MCDTAERQNDAQARQCSDASLEKASAMRNLTRRRFVFRRRAAHGVGDHAIDELQRFRRRWIVMAAGEPRLEKRTVEQLPRIVSEKGAPGTVRALQSWRKSHDEQPRRL